MTLKIALSSKQFFFYTVFHIYIVHLSTYIPCDEKKKPNSRERTEIALILFKSANDMEKIGASQQRIIISHSGESTS